jgi:hypothetical protein
MAKLGSPPLCKLGLLLCPCQLCTVQARCHRFLYHNIICRSEKQGQALPCRVWLRQRRSLIHQKLVSDMVGCRSLAPLCHQRRSSPAVALSGSEVTKDSTLRQMALLAASGRIGSGEAAASPGELAGCIAAGCAVW